MGKGQQRRVFYGVSMPVLPFAAPSQRQWHALEVWLLLCETDLGPLALFERLLPCRIGRDLRDKRIAPRCPALPDGTLSSPCKSCDSCSIPLLQTRRFRSTPLGSIVSNSTA